MVMLTSAKKRQKRWLNERENINLYDNEFKNLLDEFQQNHEMLEL